MVDEEDIGFTSSGSLDVDALLTHVGTGSSDNGYVVTWYDQSGNGNHVTQSTEGNQPLIVESGSLILSNGKPMVKFNSDYLDGSVDMGAQNPDATLNAVWKLDSDRSEAPVFLGNTIDFQGLSIGYLRFFSFRFNLIRLWEFEGTNEIIGFSSNLRVQSGTYKNNGSSSEMQVFIDGTSSGSLTTDAGEFDLGIGNTSTPIRIGANSSGDEALTNSLVGEVVVYDEVLSSTNRENFENNQLKYYGFSPIVIAGKGRNAYQLELSNGNYVGYINGDTIMTPATTGEYQHVVLTYDQTDLKIFVNGDEKNSKSLTGAIGTNSNALVIGEKFNGIIDELQISNTARSADYIATTYSNGLDELLIYDLSGFDIDLAEPGDKYENVEFDLSITNARGTTGALLNGSINVDSVTAMKTGRCSMVQSAFHLVLPQ
jgi:hypothetical protein